MKLLYLSSFCTKKRYLELFEKYRSITSHASQKYNRMMVEGLTQNGIIVEMLSSIQITKKMDKHLFHCAKPEEEDGLKFKYIPRLNINIIGNLYIIIYTFVQLLLWMKKNKHEIIFCDPIIGEFSIAIWLAGLFFKNKKVAIITDVPGFRATEKKRKGYLAFLEKIKMKSIYQYDGYIFLTQQMNDLINKDNKPYVVIEGFVDVKMKNINNSYNNKYKKKVCLMAGSMDLIFGIDKLVKAFLHLNIKDTELHLYGNGNYVDELKKISRINTNIKYFGELPNDNIIDEEIKATILINPRQPDNNYTIYSFPSKNMEYLASGTPLLAYKLPGMSMDYYDHFIQISEDSFGLFNALQRVLLDDPKNLHSFGINSKQWIIKNKNNYKQCQVIVSMLKMI